jgi:hypothetical protein
VPRHFIPDAVQPENPFEADLESIHRIQRDYSWSRVYDW